MVVHLLPPLVDKQYVTKDQYGSLPLELQGMASYYPHVYKLTITPQKSADSVGVCHVNIVAPSNWHSGTLRFINMGRIPPGPRTVDQEDMRPECLYVFGTGSMRYQCVLGSNHNIYVETITEFL